MKYFQVDAFADGVFSGNPAGVVPLEAWPQDLLLQHKVGPPGRIRREERRLRQIVLASHGLQKQVLRPGLERNHTRRVA
ncbi:MAG: hypothetical protein AAFR76_05965, partial [Planctomycetota bacterium]